MQTLTAMTLGALAIGAAAFAYDTARADPPTDCPSHEVSLYFEHGKSEFNDFSKRLVERVAAEAKACGARQIVAETKVSGERAKTVEQAFASRGVQVILVGPTHVSPTGGAEIADRAANVRLTMNRAVG